MSVNAFKHKTDLQRFSQLFSRNEDTNSQFQQFIAIVRKCSLPQCTGLFKSSLCKNHAKTVRCITISTPPHPRKKATRLVELCDWSV